MKLMHAAAAVSLSASAFAAMATEGAQWNPPPGTTARSEVRAERDHALATGEIPQGDMYGALDPARTPRSGADRADVKTELDRARANGELDGRNEGYGGTSARRPRQAT